MKIQGLAIIFIIIILPISIIIGEYASTQIQIFKLEKQYDSRLITVTDDALKAFQINTFNDATSDIADSKIKSIEASVNAFYNSMELSFGLEGYSKEDLQMYVPAIVYTMYDGYYIYSPYTNITETNGNIQLNSSNIEYGFKPYVYYSCRYKMGSDSDFIINYALDNYITIQGIVDGESVYKSGYLLTISNSENAEGIYKKSLTNGVIEYYYNGKKIGTEENLSENLVETDGTIKEYKYVKLNGTKYYWNEEEEYIFYLMGINRVKQVEKASDEERYLKYVDKIKINSSAIHYYENAYEFTTWVNNKLGNLETNNAVTEVQNSGSGKIFENEHIEYTESNFNSHRKEVIRYSIERNLSVAIANFNTYTNSGTNFQMPKLKETEWEMLENEVSIISFLQGLNLGGKIYNGYTVITNTKTQEVVKEERIYIATNDGYYHTINDKHFDTKYQGYYRSDSVLGGFLDLDFQTRKDGATGLAYLNRNELGCYTSIVGQENVNNKYRSIYEYLQKTNIENGIKKTYYTALARERWGTYKTEKPSNIVDIIDEMITTSDYTPYIVTDGLIRHLEGDNTDGYGRTEKDLDGVWVDLSGHRNGIVKGKPSAKVSYVEFDGIDDWVDLGKIESPNLTLNAVVQFPQENSNGYILSNGAIRLLIDEGNINAVVNINGRETLIQSAQKVNPEYKYNISVTYDGQTLRLYIYANERLEKKEKQVEGKITNSINDTIMVVGANPISEQEEREIETSKINIYSVKIYNRGLTEEEIAKNNKFGKIVNITSITLEPSQGWSTQVNATINARTIDVNGMGEIMYSYDKESWYSATQISIAPDGMEVVSQAIFNREYKGTVYFKAIDNAGNESDIVSREIHVDPIKPEITDIQVQEEKITITAKDLGDERYCSGIQDIQYSYDTNTWLTDNFDSSSIESTTNTMKITGTWNPLEYSGQTIYFRAIDYAGNISETKSIKIQGKGTLDLNIILDGTTYYDGHDEVSVEIKINGENVGRVKDYNKELTYGTTWEILGIQTSTEKLSYSKRGIINSPTTTINIELNTISFETDQTSIGMLSKGKFIVLKGTRYEASGNQLNVNGVGSVTATPEEAFDSWSSASGTINSKTTIKAIFKQTIDNDVTYTIKITDPGSETDTDVYTATSRLNATIKKQISVTASNGNTNNVTIKYRIRKSTESTAWSTYTLGQTISKTVGYNQYGIYYLEVQILDTNGNVLAEQKNTYYVNGKNSVI